MNHRSLTTTDLQSVPFGHSGTPPRIHGAGDGTRTRNLLITNQLLYQLSYASAIKKGFVRQGSVRRQAFFRIRLKNPLNPPCRLPCRIFSGRRVRLRPSGRKDSAPNGPSSYIPIIRNRLVLMQANPSKSSQFVSLTRQLGLRANSSCPRVS